MAVGIFHVAFLVQRAIRIRDVLLIEVLLFYEMQACCSKVG